MLETKPYVIGSLRGTIYDFPEIGDILPMHNHTEEDIHISIIARGSFTARGSAGWTTTCQSGDVLDWAPNDPHEFVALEKNSRIVNIVKNIK
jgi:quercetin dioxygenase-like cupin family protein